MGTGSNRNSSAGNLAEQSALSIASAQPCQPDSASAQPEEAGCQPGVGCQPGAAGCQPGSPLDARDHKQPAQRRLLQHVHDVLVGSGLVHADDDVANPDHVVWERPRAPLVPFEDEGVPFRLNLGDLIANRLTPASLELHAQLPPRRHIAVKLTIANAWLGRVGNRMSHGKDAIGIETSLLRYRSEPKRFGMSWRWWCYSIGLQMLSAPSDALQRPPDALGTLRRPPDALGTLRRPPNAQNT